MLRIRENTDATSAKQYYRQSDYYLEVPGEWLGKGAERIGLTGVAGQKAFDALCDNVNPATGKSLTRLTVEGRRVGWDFNFNSSKSVGMALELTGDTDILDAHREAVRYAMEHVEDDMACRVRVGGKDEDRFTRNMIAMRVTHRTTRPNEDDKTPDMELHDHVFVINATFDDEENGKGKAVQIADIMHDAPYYEAIYHNRLAANLRELGYGVRRKEMGFEIAGISDVLIDKYSRRKATIEEVARRLGIISAKAKEKLGASTRLGKLESRRNDLTAYWDSKLNDAEREQLKHLKGQSSYESSAGDAVRYAILHEFYRNSVVEARKLYETTIRFGIGSVTPQEVEEEAKKQGVLVRDGQATTRDVLAEEDRVISFARAGRGIWRPLAAADTPLDGLSDEQKAAVRHVWRSTDQLMLIRGGAGTGKTTMMTPALAKLGAPVVLLAPSSDASRGQLRQEGFKDANTVAAFLGSEDMQRSIQGGGIIWVDEAGLLSITDLDRLCAIAKDLDARIVLQGDPKQHKAVQRHGNMLTVLPEFAGLPVAELKEIKRQKGDYARAVAAIRDNDLKTGDAVLRKLGWVVEGQGHDKLVEEYGRAIEETKIGGEKKTVLVIDPTHRDGDILSEKLRDLRKEKGLIDREERSFTRLVATDMTPAQKGDAHQYAGDEVIQFFRNSGPFKAGDRVTADKLLPHLADLKPDHFAVYSEQPLMLAKGDTVRITANGWDVSGKHRIDNGRIDEISGFTPEGNPVLSNGWVIGKDFAHIRHGLVATSPASQSKTYDVVLASMNRASRGAQNHSQGYVTVSRGRECGMIFTDLSRDELLDAIKRTDRRISATELLSRTKAAESVPGNEGLWTKYMEKMRTTYRRLRATAVSRATEFARQAVRQQEPSHARSR